MTHDTRSPSPTRSADRTVTEDSGFTVFGHETVRDLRMRVAEAVAAAGFDADRTDDFTLAVNEAMTNSVRHAGGSGEIAFWFQGGTFICEVRDHGHIEDPSLGTIPPPPEQLDGRGLWIMNHLCDLVQIRPTADGQVVRLHLYS